MTERLPLCDALCGATVRVPHLDGTTLEVAVTDVITPSSVKIVRWVDAAGALPGHQRHD